VCGPSVSSEFLCSNRTICVGTGDTSSCQDGTHPFGRARPRTGRVSPRAVRGEGSPLPGRGGPGRWRDRRVEPCASTYPFSARSERRFYLRCMLPSRARHAHGGARSVARQTARPGHSPCRHARRSLCPPPLPAVNADSAPRARGGRVRSPPSGAAGNRGACWRPDIPPACA